MLPLVSLWMGFKIFWDICNGTFPPLKSRCFPSESKPSPLEGNGSLFRGDKGVAHRSKKSRLRIAYPNYLLYMKLFSCFFFSYFTFSRVLSYIASVCCRLHAQLGGPACSATLRRTYL